jgi:hypothetical protein
MLSSSLEDSSSSPSPTGAFPASVRVWRAALDLLAIKNIIASTIRVTFSYDHIILWYINM